MPLGRQFPARTVEAEDVRLRRVDPHYVKSLVRLLAAHALAEKLTALGYQRALDTVTNEALRPTIEKNLAEECRHAALVYRALREIGVTQEEADRAMIPALKAPSFEAPLRFAKTPAGELDLLMASLSLDMTGLLMIGINYRDSSYAPHARAADRILDDEAEHEMFAVGELASSVRSFWPRGGGGGTQAMAAGGSQLFRAARQRLRLRLHAFRAQGARQRRADRAVSLDARAAAGQRRARDAAADLGLPARAGVTPPNYHY